MDSGARMVGASSKSAQTAAQLETLAGWLTSNVPRMEGPQGVQDVVLYQQMAAKIGDRSIPIRERMAALDTLEKLQSSYTEIRGGKAPANRNITVEW